MYPTTSASLRIMTYNILTGGNRGRMDAIEAVIREAQPDILGIEEANDIAACRALAERLGMYCVTGYSAGGYHVALFSRWPIRSWANYGRPAFQKGLIEAVIDVPGEPLPWHIFVGHTAADFSQGYGAEMHRVAEVRAFIAAMERPLRLGHPHVLLGDFNALAPGEWLNAAELIARVSELDEERKVHGDIPGQPYLDYITPPLLHPLIPLIRAIPRTPWLAALVNTTLNLIVPRWAINSLMQAGYIDCLRARYGARNVPPTCPLPRPAGRIDYIWADPAIAAQRLLDCEAVADGPCSPVNIASDHRPILATFARVAVENDVAQHPIERIGTEVGV